MSVAVVRLRGEADLPGDVEDTLDMLNLPSVNSFTVVPDEPSYTGMLQKVHDVVAYGEADAATVATLLRRRATTDDGEDVTDDLVDDRTDYEDIDALAAALVAGETTLRDAGIAPAIGLHPPRGGHGGIKATVQQGGVVGDHGDDIDDLLGRMR
jgi:large subunit ribosomal protein L30